MRPGWAVICDGPTQRRPRVVPRCRDEGHARREATRLNLSPNDAGRPLYFPEYLRASSAIDLDGPEERKVRE